MAVVEREDGSRRRLVPAPAPEVVVIAPDGKPPAFRRNGAAGSPPGMAGEREDSLPGREIQENGMPLFVQGKELRSPRAEGEGAYRTAVPGKEPGAVVVPVGYNRDGAVSVTGRNRRTTGSRHKAGDRRRVSLQGVGEPPVPDAGLMQAARFITDTNRTVVGREGECSCTPAAFP